MNATDDKQVFKFNSSVLDLPVCITLVLSVCGAPVWSVCGSARACVWCVCVCVMCVCVRTCVM